MFILFLIMGCFCSCDKSLTKDEFLLTITKDESRISDDYVKNTKGSDKLKALSLQESKISVIPKEYNKGRVKILIC